MKQERAAETGTGWLLAIAVILMAYATVPHRTGVFAEDAHAVPAEFINLAEYIPGIVVDVK